MNSVASHHLYLNSVVQDNTHIYIRSQFEHFSETTELVFKSVFNTCIVDDIDITGSLIGTSVLWCNG